MVRVSFIRDGIIFEVPQLWVDTSATIKSMLADVELIEDHISLTVSIPIESLSAMTLSNTHQLVLPVLDFLDCDLIVRVGMDIIWHEEILTELTKQLFYDIPILAYQAYLSELLTSEELPPYSPSVTISSEEWQEFIGHDHEKLIVLINLGITVELLLPEITVKMINRLHERGDSDIPLLTKLISDLDRVNPSRLESLLRHFRYSPIIDLMIQLKQVEAIRRVHSDGLIPDNLDSVQLVLNMKSDEMVDLIMELGMNSVSDSDDYMIQLAIYALRTNYLYPLKYVTHPVMINLAIDCMGSESNIGISVEGLQLILPMITADGLVKLMRISGLSNRHDLVVVIGALIDQSSWPNVAEYCLLTDFNSEDEYREYIGVEPVLDGASLSSSLLANRYGGLLKSIIEASSIEEKIKILMIISRMGRSQCHNIKLVEALIVMITVEQFKEFNITQLEIVRDEGLSSNTIDDCYRIVLVSVTIAIRLRQRVRSILETVDTHDRIRIPSMLTPYQDTKDNRDNSIPTQIMIRQTLRTLCSSTEMNVDNLIEPYQDVINQALRLG